MATNTTQTDAAEQNDTRAAAEGKEPADSAKFWLDEIQAAGKRDEEWIRRARTVVQRYRDERDMNSGGGEKRANILWSNTELLKASIFRTLGTPDVRRRFPKRGKDEKNTKQAALVMERSASYSNEAHDSESQVEAAVEDMLLPGRGQVWVIYDAVVAPSPDGSDEIKSQSVKDEHVYWEDYRTSAGRKESDIWWKARCHYYTRDELRTYFPDDADKIPLTAQLADTTGDRKKGEDDTFKRSRVWEIWDKNKKQRVFVAEEYHTVLRKDEDPYRLVDFFPCPEPLYGCKTTSSLVPIPEFTLYQDQANELDVIATRLVYLVEALKRRGVYDAGSDGNDKQLAGLAMARDNEFLPFRGFRELLEKGGLKTVFQTEDLAPIVTAIEGLYKRAQTLVETIYEVTGISDIMRGSSEAAESATAQSIKANFGSMRLQKRQRRVQRFVRDLVRIKVELIAEHFSREQLQQMVGLDMPLAAEKQAAMQQLAALQQQAQMAQAAQQQAQQAAQHPPGPQGQPQGPGGPPPQMMGHNGGPPMGTSPMAPPPPMPDPDMVTELQELVKLPTWEDVSAILRSDSRRGYKVDVETDQTAQGDEQEEKANRIEFMSTITGMIEKALPMAMQLPQMRPLLRESVAFVIKGFKAGRPMEEAFDDCFAQLEKMPTPPPQPNPAQEVAQARTQQIQSEIQIRQQEAQLQAQDIQAEANKRQQTAAAEAAQAQLDQAKQRQELQNSAVNDAADRAIRVRQAQDDAMHKAREAERAHMDAAMENANSALASHIHLTEAAHGLQTEQQAHIMSLAERQQKMRLAEKAANQPQPGAI